MATIYFLFWRGSGHTVTLILSNGGPTLSEFENLWLNPGAHQADSRLSANVGPSVSICRSSFCGDSNTVGTSWAPLLVAFLLILHVELMAHPISERERSHWLFSFVNRCQCHLQQTSDIFWTRSSYKPSYLSPLGGQFWSHQTRDPSGKH